MALEIDYKITAKDAKQFDEITKKLETLPDPIRRLIGHAEDKFGGTLHCYFKKQYGTEKDEILVMRSISNMVVGKTSVTMHYKGFIMFAERSAETSIVEFHFINEKEK